MLMCIVEIQLHTKNLKGRKERHMDWNNVVFFSVCIGLREKFQNNVKMKAECLSIPYHQ